MMKMSSIYMYQTYGFKLVKPVVAQSGKCVRCTRKFFSDAGPCTPITGLCTPSSIESLNLKDLCTPKNNALKFLSIVVRSEEWVGRERKKGRERVFHYDAFQVLIDISGGAQK